MTIQKTILNFLSPVLKPMSKWYLSRIRYYSWNGIKLKIYPGVFHPGLFFSTHILLDYLSSEDVAGKRVLELGAGSGLVSFFLARQGAIVTASDINPVAVQALKENAKANGITISAVESDLFNNIVVSDFDLMIINPPYYAAERKSIADHAWYCGKDFEYFHQLFTHLGHCEMLPQIIMILSEDCNMNRISKIATTHHLALKETSRIEKSGEVNFIFTIIKEKESEVHSEKAREHLLELG
jgi:release factor glutamine methyltransferase